MDGESDEQFGADEGGLDVCPTCRGEGELFEEIQEFDAREMQWYPGERSLGECPTCLGTGYLEPGNA